VVATEVLVVVPQHKLAAAVLADIVATAVPVVLMEAEVLLDQVAAALVVIVIALMIILLVVLVAVLEFLEKVLAELLVGLEVLAVVPAQMVDTEVQLRVAHMVVEVVVLMHTTMDIPQAATVPLELSGAQVVRSRQPTLRTCPKDM
jgi:hypothetical protein